MWVWVELRPTARKKTTSKSNELGKGIQNRWRVIERIEVDV